MDTVAWAALAFVTLTNQSRNFDTLLPEVAHLVRRQAITLQPDGAHFPLTFKHNSAAGLISKAM